MTRMEVGGMATIPVGVAILMLVPANGKDVLANPGSGTAQILFDPAVRRAALESDAVKTVKGIPPLPGRSIPRAVDARGKIYEQVIPADVEVEVSADEEGLPSPQRPRRVPGLPPLAPAPSASPEPTI